MSSVFWCMFWGAMVFVLISAFFWLGLYASTALDDFRKALEVMRHD